MKLLAIVSDNTEKASTKYRLEQYVPLFNEHDIHVEIIRRSHLKSLSECHIETFDAVINFRCLMNLKLARKIMMSGKRTLFDFDDAIYTRPGKPHSFITSMRVKKRLHYWLKNATAVTVSNSVLATYASAYSDNVKLIKMALDAAIWKPHDSADQQAVTIGWAESPATLHYLEEIDDVLIKFLATASNVKLAVYSGVKPNLKCAFDYYPYKPDGEIDFIQSLDIGLLPTVYDDFARGKSPIKAIQYLACGIPVVGNIEGGASEILEADHSFLVRCKSDWIKQLSKLVSQQELRKKMGRRGHRFIEKYHSMDKVFEHLKIVIKGDAE